MGFIHCSLFIAQVISWATIFQLFVEGSLQPKICCFLFNLYRILPHISRTFLTTNCQFEVGVRLIRGTSCPQRLDLFAYVNQWQSSRHLSDKRTNGTKVTAKLEVRCSFRWLIYRTGKQFFTCFPFS